MLSHLAIHDALYPQRFLACQPHHEFSAGFVDPVSKDGEVLAYLLPDENFIIVCLKKEERVLPSASVNEALQAKIKKIEEDEVRKIPKKERDRIKDEIIFEMLPRAFTKSSRTLAYIDRDNELLIVDSSSPKKAEDLLSFLRKSLGSLPVMPVATQINLKPVEMLTKWLSTVDIDFGIETFEETFTIEDECELRDIETEGGAVIRCKHQNLSEQEIKNHLENGKLVHKLALTWRDKINFTVDDNLQVKRLKFLDLFFDGIEDDAEDQEQAFAADFLLMTGEISKMLNDLFNAFGGLKELS